MLDIVNLIHRLQAGEADEAEKKALADWIAKSSENEGDYHALMMLLGYSDMPNTEPVTEEEFNRGYERLQSGIRRLQRRKSRTLLVRQLAISLAVLAVLISVIYIYIAPQNQTDAIQFTNEPLANVIGLIESKHNIKIKPEKPTLLMCQFTGVIFTSASVDDILDAISRTMNVEFVLKPDRSFEVRGKGCSD